MAPHSSTLAWKIPWTEEPGRLQSMGSRKSRKRLSDFTFTFHSPLSYTGEGNGNPLHCSCLENPRDGGAWWAAIYGVAQSRTRLKRISSSSRGILIVKKPIDSTATQPSLSSLVWRRRVTHLGAWGECEGHHLTGHCLKPKANLRRLLLSSKHLNPNSAWWIVGSHSVVAGCSPVMMLLPLFPFWTKSIPF